MGSRIPARLSSKNLILKRESHWADGRGEQTSHLVLPWCFRQCEKSGGTLPIPCHLLTMMTIVGNSGMVLSACHPCREVWARSRLAAQRSGFAKPRPGESKDRESRGRFKGAIRIPLCSLSFICSDLALRCISRKSLKVQSGLISIPTGPTNIFFSNSELRICKGA
jgi:hypothetical protein